MNHTDTDTNNKLKDSRIVNIRLRYRSSHQMCYLEKGVLKNLAKFTENTCARASFLIKLQARVSFLIKLRVLRPATLLKKRLWPVWHRCFSCEFCEIFKNTFFIEHLRKTASKTWFFLFSLSFSSFGNYRLN